jgi:hypothetical protein
MSTVHERPKHFIKLSFFICLGAGSSSNHVHKQRNPALPKSKSGEKRFLPDINSASANNQSRKVISLGKPAHSGR